jgi:hypothetical protein
MRVIETTAHVGSDGLLRLEVAIEQRNQNVRVAVVVESSSAQLPPPNGLEDAWAAVHARLEAGGVRVPSPGTDNAGPVKPVELPGTPASQLLIGDRR